MSLLFDVTVSNVQLELTNVPGTTEWSDDSILFFNFAGRQPWKFDLSKTDEPILNNRFIWTRPRHFVYHTKYDPNEVLHLRSLLLQWEKVSLVGVNEILAVRDVDLWTLATGPQLYELTLFDHTTNTHIIAHIRFNVEMTQCCKHIGIRLSNLDFSNLHLSRINEILGTSSTQDMRLGIISSASQKRSSVSTGRTTSSSANAISEQVAAVQNKLRDAANQVMTDAATSFRKLLPATTSSLSNHRDQNHHTTFAQIDGHVNSVGGLATKPLEEVKEYVITLEYFDPALTQEELALSTELTMSIHETTVCEMLLEVPLRRSLTVLSCANLVLTVSLIVIPVASSESSTHIRPSYRVPVAAAVVPVLFNYDHEDSRTLIQEPLYPIIMHTPSVIMNHTQHRTHISLASVSTSIGVFHQSVQQRFAGHMQTLQEKRVVDVDAELYLERGPRFCQMRNGRYGDAGITHGVVSHGFPQPALVRQELRFRKHHKTFSHAMHARAWFYSFQNENETSRQLVPGLRLPVSFPKEDIILREMQYRLQTRMIRAGSSNSLSSYKRTTLQRPIISTNRNIMDAMSSTEIDTNISPVHLRPYLFQPMSIVFTTIQLHHALTTMHIIDSGAADNSTSTRAQPRPLFWDCWHRVLVATEPSSVVRAENTPAFHNRTTRGAFIQCFLRWNEIMQTLGVSNNSANGSHHHHLTLQKKSLGAVDPFAYFEAVSEFRPLLTRCVNVFQHRLHEAVMHSNLVAMTKQQEVPLSARESNRESNRSILHPRRYCFPVSNSLSRLNEMGAT